MRQRRASDTSGWIGWALACWLSLAVAVPAWGDEAAGLAGLDEKAALFQEIPVVTGASRYEQKVSEAPSFVTIITAEEIKLFGYRSLSDILRGVGGFYVSYDRNYATTGVRGFAPPGDLNTRLLVLVDGMRLNESIYSSGAVGTEFPLDIDLIDRVEVIRGPGSSLYGTNALLGVINVITRSGRNLKGMELSVAGGSYDTIGGRMSYGDRFANGLEMLLSGTYDQSAGNDLYYKRYDRPGTSDGVSRGCDDDRAYRLFSKVAYHGLTFEALYSNREKGIPTGAFETLFNDPRTRSWDEYGLVGVKYDHTFANQLNAMVHTYFTRYQYDGNYFYNWARPKAPPLYELEKDYGYMDRLTTEGQLSYTLFEKHKLIFGTEINYNFRADQASWVVGAPAYFEDRQNPYNWALFAQDEFHILSNLILNAGVRYDYYDSFGGTTNPRLAIIYNPWPSTALKALYGRAFRAPDAYALSYHDAVQKVSPGLQPETMDTFELIWEQQVGSGFRLTTAGYYYKIRDLITMQTDPKDGLLMFGNLDEAKALGFDVELSRQWANGISGRISYSFAQTENTQTGQVLSNSPEHMVKANVAFPLIKNKLFLGLETLYLSNRTTNANQDVGDAVVTNVTLFARNLFKNMELSGTIYNLFDEPYHDPAPESVSLRSIPQDGRSFRLKLTYSF